jgi:predicted HAD superfamily Cof-like phosphohydrolase
MSDVFQDQARFMQACDQKVGSYDADQYAMYLRLIQEETNELMDAVLANDRVEQLDALIDILVVTVGAIHSMGADGAGAWDEVMRTNFAKIDANTGRVLKRGDGKVLKPPGWQPPDLTGYLK